MLLRIFTEPQQGATYEQLLRFALASEDAGFDAFFRSDHYLRMGDGDPGPGPTDAWTTLAGLARDTRSIRLGTLLSSATFRLPGPLAVTVAQVDAMSGGRVELGLGAGWFEAEHRAFSIPFPPLAERFDRLAEQLEILRGIWSATAERPFDFEGRFYEVTSNVGLPKPTQEPHPPLIVGGAGPRRTPALAATFADEYNLPFVPLDVFTQRQADVEAACVTLGRDPGTLRRSVALVVCCAKDRAGFERRAAAIGREPSELMSSGAAGDPEQVISKLSAYRDAGAQVAYLQMLDISDLDQLSLVADAVLGEMA
ncbi:MAG: LLM class F420-dependent oxidoreductase [Acidimicrobiales bacterium]